MTDSQVKLQLYHYEGCFYCTLVRNAASDLGVELELRNIHDNPEYKQQLIDLRGRKTVPVLRIVEADGEVSWLPESRDIVTYIRRRFGDPNQQPTATLERALDALRDLFTKT